jgi:predicted DNA-binding ribbon-helix-helix protein
MTARNFLFNFIPKELLYMKNNSSKYELNLSAALRVPCTDYSVERLTKLKLLLAPFDLSAFAASSFVPLL